MPFWFARKPRITTVEDRLEALQLRMTAQELAWTQSCELVKKAIGRAYAEKKADKGGAQTDDVAPGRTNGSKMNPEVDRWRVRG